MHDFVAKSFDLDHNLNHCDLNYPSLLKRYPLEDFLWKFLYYCCCCCQLSFKVTYSQSSSTTDSNLSTSVSVMSGLGVLYALLLTWSWYRRSGRFTVDLVVMFKFLLFALGTVGDAIFLVIFGSSLYYQFLYKVGKACAGFAMNEIKLN